MAQGDVGVAIDRGLDFLRSEQQADGSFTSSSSAQLYPFVPEVTYRTCFAPSLILNALGNLPQAAAVREPLAQWLLRQRSPYWSFNYWANDSPERQTLPYPDDLDDTFCALIGLHAHDPQLVGAQALGSIVKLLLATEAEVGGPYRTWLAEKNSAGRWQDVDLAVNSNIAYFLQQAVQPLPNLTHLMELAIAKGLVSSPYYPAMLPLLYYLARAYRGPLEARLTQLIKQQPLRSPLEWALAISALTQLGCTSDVPAMTSRLLADQQTDGSWPAAAFCIDPARQGRTFYHGSKALSTALALEALQVASTQPATAARTKHAAAAATPISKLAKKELAGLDTDLRVSATVMLDQLISGDTITEIIGIPTMCAASLRTKPPLGKKSLDQLAVANLLGWLAYIILDDFLDGEGQPELLPVATVALRRSLAGFTAALPQATGFAAHVARSFDIIDNANAWEAAHCRWPATAEQLTIAKLPDYGDLRRLAERSAGHQLSLAAALIASGIDLTTQPALLAQRGFTQYLIARQLLDDAHDWEADLRAGRISYGVALLVQDLGITPGEYAFTQLLPRLQQHFWHHTLNSLCSEITSQLAAARASYQKSGLVQLHSPLIQLIDNLENVAARTRREQRNAEDFLKAYQKPLG